MISDRSYKTLTSISEGFYKEKGSKFISYAYPIESAVDVKEKLGELKKQYFDARHHCFAFILNANKQVTTRANDDGEPGHSAGDPILGQIKSFELENVLVVVVRYFGGTKLGVSGLIHAYKTAAEDALANAKIKTIVVKQCVEITYPYNKTNEVMRLAAEFEIEIKEHIFEADCLIIGELLPSRVQMLKDKLALLPLVKVK
ncbi:MAG: YigZ family protein [Cyclobacteriaceae bacterium]